MPQLGEINVVGTSNSEIEKKLDAQRTVNMYIRQTPEGKRQAALVPMAGLVSRTTSPISPIVFSGLNTVRQLYTYKDFLYAVVDDEIYKISPTHTATLLGSIGTFTGYVGVTANQTQIIWVDGANGYIYNTSTSAFSTISSAGFPTSTQDVDYLDGYFIVNRGNTNEFYISALNDGTTWSALDFAAIQSKPDTLIAVRVFQRRLFLFGKISTEVWYDQGGSGFPLARDNNLLLEYGCAAPSSIATGYQHLLWLAADQNGIGSVMMTDGTAPVPVSTPAIDYAIQRYTNVSDARGSIYKIDGHVFYELSFTADNHTWVYDVTTNKWFEKETLNKGRSIVNCHAFFNGKHYVGSYSTGAIYELSSDCYTDNGEAIRRERICAHFSTPHLQQIRITRFNLDIVTGVGLPAVHHPISFEIGNYYDDPHIYLSWSKDGGVWFDSKHTQSLGRLGDRMHRAIFRQLGTARDWVFKIEIISKSRVFILGASIEYENSGR